MSGKEGSPIAVGTIRLDVPNLAELKTSVNIANMQWHLRMEPFVGTSNVNHFSVYLLCHETSPCPQSRCEASAAVNVLSPKVGQKPYSRNFLVGNFRTNRNNWAYKKFISRDKVLDPANDFIREEDGGIVLEATVTVRNVVGLPLSTLCDFTAPQPNLTDVALMVEEKPIHVNKAYLAYHSPVFHSLFFSDFVEREKKEIPLQDVKYDEFVELLHVVFPSRKPITVSTVDFLLRLSDRFNMQVELHSCEEFLRGPESEEIPLAKKLLLTDKYRLASLQSLKSILEVKALTATKEYGDFSGEMKGELIKRILELC